MGLSVMGSGKNPHTDSRLANRPHIQTEKHYAKHLAPRSDPGATGATNTTDLRKHTDAFPIKVFSNAHHQQKKGTGTFIC